MIELGLTDDFRRVWDFLSEIHRDGQRRSPINYARTKKHKRAKRGKR